MEKEAEKLIDIRPASSTDVGLIIEGWLTGYYHGNKRGCELLCLEKRNPCHVDFFREVGADTYFSHYGKVIVRILERPNTVATIASLKEDPDTMVGFSVREDSLLHWVYVKPPFRNHGIGRQLIGNGVTTVTHLTKIGRSIKPKEWIFNPFLI